MKLTSSLKLTILNKEETISESTGKKGYKLAVMQKTEAGSITCSKDVFDIVKPMHNYDFSFTYDDKYNYGKLTGVDIKSERQGLAL